MDEKNNRTPKPGPAPSKPFFRPATGLEKGTPAQDQKRRLNVPPFQGPGARPQRAKTTVATPITPATPVDPAVPTMPAMPRPARSKTPVIVPALVMPAFEEAVDAPVEELPVEVVPNELQEQPAAHEPESVSAQESPEQRTSDETLEIVVGESLLEITGEYPKVGWDSLQAREKPEVEPVMDWSSRAQKLEENTTPAPNEKDALEITSEGGLDWDSWEFGRDTSDFAAQGEGFVINRHELSPEASEMGASHGAFDTHRAESPKAEDEIEQVTGEHPEVDFTSVTESVARDEEPQPPVLSLPSISEFQMTERSEAESAERLEALKEVEPWAMPAEPRGDAAGHAGAADDVASALERIAQRLRRGEIALPKGAATGNDELALAAALAAILRTPEQ